LTVNRKLSPETKKAKYKDTTVAGLLDKLRTTLRNRGATVLALAKQFAVLFCLISILLKQIRLLIETIAVLLIEKNSDLLQRPSELVLMKKKQTLFLIILIVIEVDILTMMNIFSLLL